MASVSTHDTVELYQLLIHFMQTEQAHKPTPDDIVGMSWWNALTPLHRAYVLSSAGTASPATAWAWFKLNGWRV